MMKNKKIFYGILAVCILAIVGIGLFMYLSRPTPQITPIPEGQIIVKQSGGEFALPAECGDKNYITNTADYIIEGIVEKVESKLVENEEGGKVVLTYTDLEIKKYIKGTPFKTNKLQIVTLGGCAEGLCLHVEDQPILHEGKEVRIYLKKVSEEREFGEQFSIVCGRLGVEEIEVTTECKDECPLEGGKECVAIITKDGQEITGFRICGNYDSDSCLEWSEIFTCLAGTTCVNGTCEALPSKKTPLKFSLTTKYEKAGMPMLAEGWEKELKERSDFVFEGKVKDVRTKLESKEDGGKMVYTYSTISVEKIIKEELKEEIKIVSPMTLIIPGGCAEGLCVSADHGPEFEEGKYVRVYLSYSDGESRVLHVEEVPPVFVTKCNDECSPEGNRECVITLNTITGESTDGYRICGNYDDDSCLEWSETFPCPNGTICKDGNCKELPAGKPDLVVEYVWYSLEGIIYYEPKNIGKAPVGWSISHLYINGNYVGDDGVGPLEPDQFEHLRGFEEHPVSCINDKMNITVCTDGPGRINESNETNNCFSKIVECNPVYDDHFPEGWALLMSGWVPGPLKEPQDAKNMLREFGFLENHIRIVEHPNATVQYFNDSIEWLKHNADEKSVIYIWISHHGNYQGIILSDGWLGYSTIAKAISDLKDKGTVIFIADCCYSGALIRNIASMIDSNNTILVSQCGDCFGVSSWTFTRWHTAIRESNQGKILNRDRIRKAYQFLIDKRWLTAYGNSCWLPRMIDLTQESPDWDVNRDGEVDIYDILKIRHHWEETGQPHWIREDVNRDGRVNVLDIILVGQHRTDIEP